MQRNAEKLPQNRTEITSANLCDFASLRQRDLHKQFLG
jgi:hypothetical protein